MRLDLVIGSNLRDLRLLPVSQIIALTTRALLGWSGSWAGIILPCSNLSARATASGSSNSMNPKPCSFPLAAVFRVNARIGPQAYGTKDPSESKREDAIHTTMSIGFDEVTHSK